ncbi:thiamine phosphate synthase [Thermodesulfovibrionales bacterium]|nr:thiamine phosphate synthase [Thermodesulfovibrionales bacterium]
MGRQAVQLKGCFEGRLNIKYQRLNIKGGKQSNRLQVMDFRLYLITDRKLFITTPLMLTAVEDALKAGVKAVQLRERDLPTRELLDIAYKMKELTIRHDGKLFINDSLDIALCVGADGVHLGQSSMPVYAVRRVVGDRALIGASTHNLDEAAVAEREGADFITFGPIYHTASKLKYGEPVGIESLRRIREKVSTPIFGIGGVKPHNVDEVVQSGAYGVAVISGILGEDDTEKAAKEYIGRL